MKFCTQLLTKARTKYLPTNDTEAKALAVCESTLSCPFHSEASKCWNVFGRWSLHMEPRPEQRGEGTQMKAWYSETRARKGVDRVEHASGRGQGAPAPGLYSLASSDIKVMRRHQLSDSKCLRVMEFYRASINQYSWNMLRYLTKKRRSLTIEFDKLNLEFLRHVLVHPGPSLSSRTAVALALSSSAWMLALELRASFSTSSASAAVPWSKKVTCHHLLNKFLAHWQPTCLHMIAWLCMAFGAVLLGWCECILKRWRMSNS